MSPYILFRSKFAMAISLSINMPITIWSEGFSGWKQGLVGSQIPQLHNLSPLSTLYNIGGAGVTKSTCGHLAWWDPSHST